MDDFNQLSAAMLAIVCAAVLLVAGQLYIEQTSSSRQQRAMRNVKALSMAEQPRAFAARYGRLLNTVDGGRIAQ